MGEFIKLDDDLVLKSGTIPAGVYSAHDWLKIRRLSCHFLLQPNGEFIKQRSTKEICWHAKGFNTGSIGIEVLVPGEHNLSTLYRDMKTDWVSDEQYKNLVEMSQGIIDFFGIKDVKRHSDLSPDRKQDPGTGFRWNYFLEQLNF